MKITQILILINVDRKSESYEWKMQFGFNCVKIVCRASVQGKACLSHYSEMPQLADDDDVDDFLMYGYKKSINRLEMAVHLIVIEPPK